MSARAEKLAQDIKRDTLNGIARALADEAVLIVARLEELDRVLTGDADAWLGIMEKAKDLDIAEITINAPLAEARQQATALKALLAELAKALGQDVPVAAPASKSDELAARRAERRQSATGSGS